MTLAVVTDSAACLPPALADRRGIEVVPLHVIDDGAAPTTARPSVAELVAAGSHPALLPAAHREVS